MCVCLQAQLSGPWERLVLAALQACERGGGSTVGWMWSRSVQLLVVLNHFLLQEHFSRLKKKKKKEKKKGALGFRSITQQGSGMQLFQNR